jgi:hypothetical protein
MAMPISRKSTKPVGITNASGQPEIVLEIDGLTISMAPPSRGIANRDVANRDVANRDVANRDVEGATEDPEATEPPAEER